MACILAIDLGKFKSVACMYDAKTAEHRFETTSATPQALHDLIVEHEPERVVIEVGAQAGLLGYSTIQMQKENTLLISRCCLQEI